MQIFITNLNTQITLDKERKKNMANQQAYAAASVYINGSRLSEEASVTVEFKKLPFKKQKLGTTCNPFPNIITEIDISNAVPSVDFEFDPTQFMFGNNNLIELTIFAAGRTLTVKGSIMSSNFSHVVDSASKLDFKFTGGKSEWD